MNSLARTSMPETTALTVPSPAVHLGTLSATTGAGLLEAAASLATPLKALIDSRHLSNVISGRPYVKCEGWTAMAAMLGITPHEVEVTEKDGVFTAVVELRRINDGQSIARASAECGAPDELDRKGQPLWASRPRYARRSMALTRATAKACRLAFSWVIVLAGYEATPAEEMPDHGNTIDVTPTKPTRTTENGPPDDASDSETISDKQRNRLYAIAKEAGWKDAEMKAELKKRFGYEHSKDIPWRRYTDVVDFFKNGPEPPDGL